ncbi:MAG: Rieske 2Fe-2S domain-containing protein [Candidatus Dormibacteria bacterium]
MVPAQLVDRIVARAGFLDPLGSLVQSWVGKGIKAGGPAADYTKQFLNGSWLGHPLHPALTAVPLGSWIGSSLLDVADAGQGGGLGQAADVLLGAGCVAGTATALTGLADWQDSYGHERDVGLTHALVNSAALLLSTTSLGLRLAGRRRPAVKLSLLALGLAGSGGYLGGELVFRFGQQVNRNAFTEGPDKWQEVAPDAEIEEGVFLRKQVGNNKVLLTRVQGTICAASAVCPHAGGPLDELPLEDGELRCPWHGSHFDIRTGRVTHGPATSPNVVFQTRVREGKVELRRPPL